MNVHVQERIFAIYCAFIMVSSPFMILSLGHDGPQCGQVGTRGAWRVSVWTRISRDPGHHDFCVICRGPCD